MSKSRLRKIISMCAVILMAGAAYVFQSYRADDRQGVSMLTQVATSTAETENLILDDESNDAEMSDGTSKDASSILDTDHSVIQTNATILHVVDGDTFDADLDDVGKVRIRMLGVNTPETVDPRKTVECFGRDASDFSKKTLVIGARIRLDPDPQADERDKYGRLLRNVVLEDGTDYNALLVREGYAYAYLSFPLDPKRKVYLKSLEREAKEAGRGLWAGCR